MEYIKVNLFQVQLVVFISNNMPNLLIKDIECVSTEEATNVSAQDQAMTLGGCHDHPPVVVVIVVSPPPRPRDPAFVF